MIYYFEKDSRFYILELTKDLFGKCCITKTWGSLKTNWQRCATGMGFDLADESSVLLLEEV